LSEPAMTEDFGPTESDDEGRVESDLARLDGKRKRNGLYLAVLAILLAVLGGLLFLLARQLGLTTDGAATIEVPNVVGRTSAEATRAVSDSGLVVTVVSQPNEKFAADIVFETKPEAGKKVAKGANVTVKVSTGISTPIIPNVVGDTVEVARAKLLASGFSMDPMIEESDTAAPGSVIRQDPAGDSDATAGQKVTVFVAKATGTVEIPDVAGKTPEDAKIDLTKIGFRVAVQQEASPTIAKGTVVRTEPAAAAKIDRGSSVVIFVSAGKSIAVPSVIGTTQDAARTALTGAGFIVDATARAVTTPSDAGRVMSQTPSPGAEAEPGATVVIRVGVLSAETTTTARRRPVTTAGPPPDPTPEAAPTPVPVAAPATTIA
jgi:eukaryotic-like serine/threonine-protein kinase